MELSNKDLGQYLKKIREELGYSIYDVNELCNISPSYLSLMENGKRKPSAIILKKIAPIYNLNYIDLYEKAGYIDLIEDIKKSKIETIKINILGRVAAGRDILAEEEIIDTIDIPKNWTKEGYEYFGLEVHGNSMYPRILNGDYVIVKQQNFVEEDGNIGIVIINGYEAVVKKIYKTKNGLTLRSFNPNYEDINFTIEEVKNLPVTIIGRVVKLIGNDFEE